MHTTQPACYSCAKNGCQGVMVQKGEVHIWRHLGWQLLVGFQGRRSCQFFSDLFRYHLLLDTKKVRFRGENCDLG